jgi:hypothetical protein
MDQALTDTLKQIVGSTVVFWLTQFAVGLGLLFAVDKFFKLVEDKLFSQFPTGAAPWPDLLCRPQTAFDEVASWFQGGLGAIRRKPLLSKNGTGNEKSLGFADPLRWWSPDSRM